MTTRTLLKHWKNSAKSCCGLKTRYNLCWQGPSIYLTTGEDELARLILEGLTTEEIARRLDVKEKTAKTYMDRLYWKINPQDAKPSVIQLAMRLAERRHGESGVTCHTQEEPAAEESVTRYARDEKCLTDSDFSESSYV
jgi:hypothetical protein